MEYYTNNKITELPHLLGTQYTKSISDGQVKEQYQLRYLVLNDEANSFIKSLPVSYEEHALASTSRDERGGFSIITAQYGEAGMTDEALQNEDGEIHWWTLSSGKYTFHVKKLVRNTPEAIKAFCERCKTSYGYAAEETSVTMSPSYGEKYVYAEATFTENENQGGSGGGSGDGDFDDEKVNEKGIIDELTSVNFSSTQTVITPSPKEQIYLEHGNTNDGISASKIFQLMQREDRGELIYRKEGDLNGLVKKSGWYDATNDNLKSIEDGSALKEEEVDEATKSAVDSAREATMDIKPIILPSITVTISGKISSRDKLSIDDISDKISKAGEKTPTISVNGFSMEVPDELNKYPILTKWMNMGASFDVNSVKKKYCKKKNIPYYVGNYTQSFATVTEIYTDYQD